MMMVVMVAVVVVVMAPICLRATGLMEGFTQLGVHLPHQLDGPGDLTGQGRLAIGGHGRTPFLELLDMPLVMFYPVLQHDPQLFYIIHLVSHGTRLNCGSR
jgi:hypothetical protein